MIAAACSGALLMNRVVVNFKTGFSGTENTSNFSPNG